MMTKKLLLLFAFAIILASCAPKEKLIYFQGIEKTEQGNDKSEAAYEPLLQPDDLLLIIVSAPDPEAAMPYNLIAYSTVEEDKTATARYQTYLLDSEGNIQFPVIGTIKLGGLNKAQAVEKVKGELSKYIKSPIVNMRIMNYKVSVLGEVARPGSYPVDTERITLPEAISKAGDMTIYGDRKQVLVIRESNGAKTHNFVDITSAKFINSPFYYLDQNDVVYVQPNKTKINSSVIGPNITAGLTAISLAITVIALLIR